MSNRKICNMAVDDAFDERLFRRAVLEAEQCIMQTDVTAHVEGGAAWAEVKKIDDVSQETMWAIGCIARNIIHNRYRAMTLEKIKTAAPQSAAVGA